MKNKFTIIGVGLIGGSFARAIKENNLASHISGFDTDRENLKKAVDLNVIDSSHEVLKDAVTDSDIIVLSLPVLSIVENVRKIVPFLKPGAIITDTGSVKEKIICDVTDIIKGKDISFVGTHPIAGKERSGVSASSSDLFRDARCIIATAKDSSEAAVLLIKDIWDKIGSKVVLLTPYEHDRIFAAVSHLPHIVAYSLVNSVGSFMGADKMAEFAAGGFKDITRIASSNPEMWLDICALNKEELINSLDSFLKTFNSVKRMIEDNDHTNLKKEFIDAKKLRDSIS